MNSKTLLLAALLLMLVGTGLELYLLDHFEDTQQLIPLLCLGASLLLLLLLQLNQAIAIVRNFQVVLLLTALSGAYGCYLHLRVNIEFEQEMRPTASSWDVLVESWSGALPALAPGSLIAFALIGYTYLQLLKNKK